MTGDFFPVSIFFSAFAASATAGIAAYLRSGKNVTKLALITSGLNSGLLGLSISLIWYHQFQDNIYSLVGICVISGLTGAAGLDFILTAIQKGGITVNLGGKENHKIGFQTEEEEKNDKE